MDLCLGTAQLGMRYGVQNNGRPDSRERERIISTALKKGIFWFDTASAYGTAETVLGHYILEHPDQAGQMHIISKITPDAFTDVSHREWREIALKCGHETLKRLNRQQLDVYMLHNASWIFTPEAVDALDSVRREGLTKSIGVSIYTPEEAMYALSCPQINAIQVPYNVFDQRLDQCGFFSEARKKQVKIYARSSLLQGLATMKADQLPAHLKFAAPYVKMFHSICERAQLSPLRVAIGFVVSHIDITYLVFGVDNQKQLLQYFSLASDPLPTDVLNELKEAFGSVEERFVNPSLWNQG